MPSTHARHWTLDPHVTFLNHGSFGACPREVLEHQVELRARMEREPVLFLARELEPLLDDVRQQLGAFLVCNPDDLALMPNATAGVNTVLRSLTFEPGDELLTTNQEYNATRNALAATAERTGAKQVIADVPFPVASAEQLLAPILEKLTPRTRLVLVDHVTSQTGLIFPIAELARTLEARGIPLLVDAAHAPGMLPLELEALGVPYYTGNCHKWMCTPKGSAFLYVRRDRQAQLRPLSISHGANSTRTDRSRFRVEFDWIGTVDPTPWLCIPTAIRVMGALLPNGWSELQRSNRELVIAGRRLLCEALAIDAPAPEELLGSLASVPIPDGAAEPPSPPLYLDRLQRVLFDEHRIEVPVMPWPAPPKRLLRISAQLYNSLDEYRQLANALSALGVREGRV